MKNFVKSTIIGIVIYLITFLINYSIILDKLVFIILLVIGGIFFIPLLAFVISFMRGFFQSIFTSKRGKNRK